MTTHPRRAVLCCEIDLAIANRNKIWPVCFELEFGELSLRGTPYRDRHAKRLTTQKTAPPGPPYAPSGAHERGRLFRFCFDLISLFAKTTQLAATWRVSRSDVSMRLAATSRLEV
jgi:hypothetical protein